MTADGWEPDLFRELAQTRLAAGDTAGAIDLAALVAVDPLEGEDLAAVLGAAALGRLDGRSRTRLLERAGQELERRVLAEAAERPLPGRVAVRSEGGDIRPLRTLLGRPATLLLYCAPITFLCDRDLPKLASATGFLRESGADVVLVTGPEEEPGAELPGTRRIDLPHVADFRGDVAQALDNWKTRQYVILNEDGRIRFHHGNLKKALRQAIVLARSNKPPD